MEAMKKDLVCNLIILDESGSMHSLHREMIEGVNGLFQNINAIAMEYPEQEHRISFVVFSSDRIKTVMNLESANGQVSISSEDYRPRGNTPLYDAIGKAIMDLKLQIAHRDNVKVLVSIFTDGMENNSRVYNAESIKRLVAECEENGYTFTYIGAEHDIYRASRRMNIRNTKQFHKSPQGIRRMMEEDYRERSMYYDKIRKNDRNLRDGYFRDEDR